LKKLLEQYNRDSLPDESQKLEALADRFEQLPLSFMKFHGGSDVDDVLGELLLLLN
jgi:twinkle protein